MTTTSTMTPARCPAAAGFLAALRGCLTGQEELRTLEGWQPLLRPGDGNRERRRLELLVERAVRTHARDSLRATFHPAAGLSLRDEPNLQRAAALAKDLDRVYRPARIPADTRRGSLPYRQVCAADCCCHASLAARHMPGPGLDPEARRDRTVQSARHAGQALLMWTLATGRPLMAELEHVRTALAFS